MKDLTYTVLGSFFGKSKKLVIDVAIPKEPEDIPYPIFYYKIGKKIIGSIEINVVICNLRLDRDRFPAASSEDVKYEHSIISDFRTMTSYPDPQVDDFDYNNKTCLILFIHDDEFGASELGILYEQIEKYYSNAFIFGSFVDDPSYPNSLYGKPRTLGVSIIRQ